MLKPIAILVPLLIQTVLVTPAPAAELSAAERLALKANWKLSSDPGPYVWEPRGRFDKKGFRPVAFAKASSLTNLPPIFKDPEIADRLELKVVGGTLSTFHRTRFSSIEQMVKISPTGAKLKGKLNAKEIRFSNSGQEEGFYTDLDPFSGNLNLGHNEGLLQIKLPRIENAFLLSLKDPLDDETRNRILTKLSGDPSYWDKYQDQHMILMGRSKKAMANLGPNYDLFMNAVVQVLQKTYKLPVDMTFYSAEFTTRPMGKLVENSYKWPVVYDRSLLEGAEVTNFHFLPLTSTQYRIPGLSQQRPANKLSVPMTKKLLGLVQKYPQLTADLQNYSYSTSMNRLIAEWNATNPSAPFNWQKFDFSGFVAKLQGTGVTRIASRLTDGVYNSRQMADFARELFLKICQKSFAPHASATDSR